MKAPTLSALLTLLAADPPDGDAERLALSKALARFNVAVNGEAADRILSYRAAGERFGRSARTLKSWVRTGILRPFRLPGGCRAAGVSLAEIERLLTAGAHAPQNGGPA